MKKFLTILISLSALHLRSADVTVMADEYSGLLATVTNFIHANFYAGSNVVLVATNTGYMIHVPAVAGGGTIAGLTNTVSITNQAGAFNFIEGGNVTILATNRGGTCDVQIAASIVGGAASMADVTNVVISYVTANVTNPILSIVNSSSNALYGVSSNIAVNFTLNASNSLYTISSNIAQAKVNAGSNSLYTISSNIAVNFTLNASNSLYTVSSNISQALVNSGSNSLYTISSNIAQSLVNISSNSLYTVSSNVALNLASNKVAVAAGTGTTVGTNNSGGTMVFTVNSTATGGATNWSIGNTNATRRSLVHLGTNATGAIKTISEGSNVTFEEQTTNIVINATLAGGAASLGDVTNGVTAWGMTNDGGRSFTLGASNSLYTISSNISQALVNNSSNSLYTISSNISQSLVNNSSNSLYTVSSNIAINYANGVTNNSILRTNKVTSADGNLVVRQDGSGGIQISNAVSVPTVPGHIASNSFYVAAGDYRWPSNVTFSSPNSSITIASVLTGYPNLEYDFQLAQNYLLYDSNQSNMLANLTTVGHAYTNGELLVSKMIGGSTIWTNLQRGTNGQFLIVSDTNLAWSSSLGTVNIDTLNATNFWASLTNATFGWLVSTNSTNISAFVASNYVQLHGSATPGQVWTATNLNGSGTWSNAPAGASSLTTNANQFGADTTLTLKSGLLVTNPSVYGVATFSLDPVLTGWTNTSGYRTYINSTDYIITNNDAGWGLIHNGNGIKLSQSADGPSQLYTGTQVTNVVVGKVPSIVTNSIDIPAGAWTPASNGPYAGMMTNGFDVWDYYGFDDTANESICCRWTPGPGFAGYISANVYWYTTNILWPVAATSNIVWELSVVPCATNQTPVGGVIFSTGANVTNRAWSSNVTEVATLTALNVNSNLAPRSFLAMRLTRHGTNATSKLLGDAQFLKLSLSYTKTNFIGGY